MQGQDSLSEKIAGQAIEDQKTLWFYSLLDLFTFIQCEKTQGYFVKYILRTSNPELEQGIVVLEKVKNIYV